MSRRRHAGAFLLTALLFGGTFVAVKAGLAYLPPLTFLAIRFDVGAVVLAGYAATRLSWSDLRPRTAGDVVAVLATGGLVVGLTNALLFVGQESTSSGVAAIVFSLNPILTVAAAAVLLPGRRPTRLGLLGTALGLVGVILVAGPTALLTGEAAGVPLLVGGAASIALGSVVIRWAEPTLSTTARTVWGVPLAALLSHGLAVAAGESLASVTLPPTALVAVAYVGVGSGAVAYLAYFALVDGVGPRRANLVFYAVPVVSTVGGWALLGERIGATALAGFAVVAAGFALLVAESVDRRRLQRLVYWHREGERAETRAEPRRAD
ncbi:DMT family transporter [Halobaculum sp. MBLA0147]|uniref:DMT family transporter n=1 Tax=Halobaculum sp. MBLA0147 TaxID=3079934 RepID=UPI003524CF36